MSSEGQSEQMDVKRESAVDRIGASLSRTQLGEDCGWVECMII